MTLVLVVLLIILLALCALLNLATLPGNWIMAILVMLWVFLGPTPPTPYGPFYFILFFGMAVAGEVVEFWSQIRGAKKHGSSGSSTVFGMIGAIAGAIMFAPFLFGIGALFGALGGAWTGSFLGERFFSGKETKEAVTSANGAMLGRFLGMTVKFGLGIGMVALTASKVWPL